MAVQLLVALLALASLAAASEPKCEDLVKPRMLEDHSIYGKWVYHVGAGDDPSFTNDLKTFKSSWIDISTPSANGVGTLYWADHLTSGKCVNGVANATYSGGSSRMTFTIDGQTTEHEGNYLETCPDCLLSTDSYLVDTPEGQIRRRYIFLFTRTGTLGASHLETFKKQAECLNFHPEYHFGDTDLCPDERETSAQ